ncbi:hypothetical protein LCGC14_1249820 [marine sediment metagenome]|uniref:Uncharacterized protein n=1 Tax=marine sediment metagenome TaxID=412755 RepID=A0A0F9P7D6_9ZZZZ
MPVTKCPNGKWKIGSGGCNFDSKAKAKAAYKVYLAKKHKNERENLKDKITSSKEDLKLIGLELSKQKKIVIKYVKS